MRGTQAAGKVPVAFLSGMVKWVENRWRKPRAKNKTTIKMKWN